MLDTRWKRRRRIRVLGISSLFALVTECQSLSIVLISTLPGIEHLLPLRALTQELRIRGHNITVAVPEAIDNPLEGLISSSGSVGSGSKSSSKQTPSSIHLLPLGKVTSSPSATASTSISPSASTSKAGGKSRLTKRGKKQSPAAVAASFAALPSFPSLSFLSWIQGFFVFYDEYLAFLKYCLSSQKSMYAILHEAFITSRPDLVIVDRYAFAAMDVCHALGLDYVINNPTFLSDIDNPPSYIPPPHCAYALGRENAWQRAMHLPYRLFYRLRMADFFHNLNLSRKQHGLGPIHSGKQLYGNHLILTNTVFGIDYPRPLNPLIKMVGPVMENVTSSEPVGVAAFNSWASVFASNMTLALFYLDQQKEIPTAEITRIADGIVQSNIPTIWILSPIQAEQLKAAGLPPPSRTLFVFVSTSIILLLGLLRHERVSLVATSCSLPIASEAMAHGKRLLCLPKTLENREVAFRLRSQSLASLCKVEDNNHTTVCVKQNFEHLLKTKKNRMIHTTAWLADLLKGGEGGGRSGVVAAADHVLKERKEDLIPYHDRYPPSSSSSSLLPWPIPSHWDVYFVYAVILLSLIALVHGIWRALLRYWLIAPTIKRQNQARLSRIRGSAGRPFPFSTLCEAAAAEYSHNFGGGAGPLRSPTNQRGVDTDGDVYEDDEDPGEDSGDN